MRNRCQCFKVAAAPPLSYGKGYGMASEGQNEKRGFSFLKHVSFEEFRYICIRDY